MDAEAFTQIVSALEKGESNLRVSVSYPPGIDKIVWSAWDYVMGPERKFYWEMVPSSELTRVASSGTSSTPSSHKQLDDIDASFTRTTTTDLITTHEAARDERVLGQLLIANAEVHICAGCLSRCGGDKPLCRQRRNERIVEENGSMTESESSTLQTSTVTNDSCLGFNDSSTTTDHSPNALQNDSLLNIGRLSCPNVSSAEEADQLLLLPPPSSLADELAQCGALADMTSGSVLDNHAGHDLATCVSSTPTYRDVPLTQMNIADKADEDQPDTFSSDGSLFYDDTPSHEPTANDDGATSSSVSGAGVRVVSDVEYAAVHALSGEIARGRHALCSVETKLLAIADRRLLIAVFLFVAKNRRSNTAVHAVSFLMDEGRMEWYSERAHWFLRYLLDVIPRLKASLQTESPEETLSRMTSEWSALLELLASIERSSLLSTNVNLEDSWLIAPLHGDSFMVQCISHFLQSQANTVVLGSNIKAVRKMQLTLYLLLHSKQRWCTLLPYSADYSPYVKLQGIRPIQEKSTGSELCDERKDDEAVSADLDLTAVAICAWDAEFLKVDHETLFEIINVLRPNVRGLLAVGMQAVANKLKGKSTEEMRTILNVRDDFTSADEQDQLPNVILNGGYSRWPICVIDVDKSTVQRSNPTGYRKHMKVRNDLVADDIRKVLGLETDRPKLSLKKCSPGSTHEDGVVREFIHQMSLLPYDASIRTAFCQQFRRLLAFKAYALLKLIQARSETTSGWLSDGVRKALDLQSDADFLAVLAVADEMNGYRLAPYLATLRLR